jgi:beta-barrel assembly-enhancing protease
MPSWFRASSALVLAVALGASPAAAELRKPGVRPATDTPEAGLWDLMDKAEAQARRSAEVNTDPALNAYVRDLTCKIAPEYCAELRIYIMDRPFVNASMGPNGYGEVWSGLLLRAESEAELAFVLGHEVSHFAENHTAEQLQAHKVRQNLVLAASIGVAVLGASAAASATTYDGAQSIIDATGNLIDAMYLGSIAAYFRFSREHETESDRLGVRRITAAGYPATAAPQMWRITVQENAASDFDRVRKRDARLGIFDSHPLTKERLRELEAEAAKLPTAGDEGRDRLRAAIRPHLGRWLRDDLRRRDFGQTLFLIDRLASTKTDRGVLEFYRGETYRLRRKEGDEALAEAAYAAASMEADAPDALWRELGDLRRRRGDAAGALIAYETYLQRAPAAEDAWLVQDALHALKKVTP